MKVVPSGRFLNGESLDFVITKSDIPYNGTEESLLIYIRPPKNYNSPFFESIKDVNWYGLLPEPTFGFIQISQKSYKDVKSIVYASNLFHEKDKFVYIERFYMLNNYLDFGNLLNEDEKTTLKGLGSILFCLAIGYLVETGLDLEDNNYIALLEAESPKCFYNDIYQDMSEDQLVLELYNKYSMDFSIFLSEEAWVFTKKKSTQRIKAMKDLLCKITANKSLIKYYNTEYNFEVLYKNKGYDTYMYSKLSDVVTKCNPKKLVNDIKNTKESGLRRSQRIASNI
jgi:hypothetical protein